MKKTSIKLINTLISSIILMNSCTSAISPENSALAYIKNGNHAAEKGKFELAKKEYNLALRVDPKFITAKRNLGIVQVKLAQYKEAIECLKEIITSYKKDAEIFYYLGEAYRGLSLYADALDIYNKGLEIAPNDDRIIKSIAWVYLKQNKITEAKKTIQDFYINNPRDVQLMLIMSKILIKSKNYNKTLVILKDFEDSNYKLKSTNKELAETEKILLLDVLGEAYYELNNCEKSQKLYEMILNVRPFLTSALTKSAKCDIKLGHINEAQMKLEKAQASDPNDPDTLFWLGQVYASTSSQKSNFYYQRFLDRSENDPSYSTEISRAQTAISLH